MKRWMDQFQKQGLKKEIKRLTKPQEIAIVQAWNAMVGNWEPDFRREDLVAVLGGGNEHLLALIDTPLKKGPLNTG